MHTPVRVVHVALPATRYDLKADRWVPMASMDTKRKHLGVAALDSMLYAVGGRDESTELSSVERWV